MRFLVFGGSFNPPHLGHLLLAQEARQALGYDAVILVPAFQPPNKVLERDPGFEARLEMLLAAADGEPGLVVDGLERVRGGVSYTIDTIRAIAARPDCEGRPGLLLGEDQAAQFSAWASPDALAAEAELVLARRDAQAGVDFSWPHRALDNALIPISSSLVRSRIAAGLPFRRFLPDPVWRLIVERAWYRG